MRRSRMTDKEGRWIEENLESREINHYHHAKRRERQAGEAQEKWVKLT
jgi:hypothetical protein